MNVQELLLKMGIDISDVGKGMRHAEDDVKKSGKQFEFLGAKLGELKKGARELGHEFPILGKLALSAISPIEGAIAIAVLAVAFFKEKLDKINESLDKQAELAADPIGVKTFEAKQEAVRQAAKEVEQFEAQMRKAVDTEDDFHKAVENSIAALQRKAAAEQEVAGIEERMSQGRLQDRLNAGLISEADAIKGKAELDKKAIQDKFEREKKLREDTINLQKQDVDNAAKVAAEKFKKAQDALAVSGSAHVAAVASTGRMGEAEKAFKDVGMTVAQAGGAYADELKDRTAQGWFHPIKNAVGLWKNWFGGAELTQAKGKAETAETLATALKSAKERADADKEADEKAKIASEEFTGQSVAAAKALKDQRDKQIEVNKQQEEWLQNQTMVKEAQKAEIDASTRRAVGGLSGLAGVTSEDRRQYMPTLQEMATSGHWNTTRSWGGAFMGRNFVSDSPFAADAQQMLRLQGNARFDSLHGNFEQRDRDILNIKDLHAKMVKEGAVEAGPQDVADDFKAWLLKTGLNVKPVMGE